MLAKPIVLTVVAAAALVAAAMNIPATAGMETEGYSAAAETTDEREWKAVAPGQVEPWSGEIKIAAAMGGRIRDVLAHANDKVFAGQLLIRLDDEEARAQVEKAQARVAMHKKIRNDAGASGLAGQRRRAEDAAADAESAVVEARAVLDQAVGGSDAANPPANINSARQALARAQDRLKQRQSELQRLVTQANMPLPTQSEGQLQASRAELTAAWAELEKTKIRASIDGTVLKMNAKPGEVAGASPQQPLLTLGDVSALRVRAELDEHDLGVVAVGQSAVVRTDAFPGKEFAGKVSSIAPLIERAKIHANEQSSSADRVVEVRIDLTEPGQLVAGMKVDVYFP
jgi:HlyD family secretion protein